MNQAKFGSLPFKRATQNADIKCGHTGRITDPHQNMVNSGWANRARRGRGGGLRHGAAPAGAECEIGTTPATRQGAHESVGGGGGSLSSSQHYHELTLTAPQELGEAIERAFGG